MLLNNNINIQNYHQKFRSLYISPRSILIITWKGKYRSTDNTKNRKRRWKLLPKNGDISRWKAHSNKQNLNWNVSMITNVFFNQKIYSLLTEKDICDCQNVSVKILYVCVCLLSGELFIFLVRVSSFFSYFFCILIISSVL